MSAGVPRRAALAALAGLGLGVPLAGAGAATPGRFPQRPVRLVVPYSVGIGPDVVARAVAERLAPRWGQPVVVDNKPRASGIVGFADVRRTPADGHTLYVADTATLAVNPLLHATLPYDPAHDLEPLTLLFQATFLLWVGGASRFDSLAAMLDAARAAPDRVSYASLGNGHASHIAVETFARAAGLRMLHVPFKDTGAMLAAVAASDVDFTAIGMNTVAGLFARGGLRPLAVASGGRLPDPPRTPTLSGGGGPPVTMHPWAALVTDRGTPPEVLARLRDDLAVALADPGVRARVEQAGFELTPSTPQALRDRVAADASAYAPLVAEGRVTRF